MKYEAPIIEIISLPNNSILAGSIKGSIKITTKRGQKVDEYDLSSSEFSHDWDMKE